MTWVIWNPRFNSYLSPSFSSIRDPLWVFGKSKAGRFQNEREAVLTAAFLRERFDVELRVIELDKEVTASCGL